MAHLRILAFAPLTAFGIPVRRMSDLKKPLRNWRVIAQELATETDPAKIRALLEEFKQAAHFIRYEDEDDSPVGQKLV